MKTPRDLAYAIVKRLGMAYSLGGCDLQLALERVIETEQAIDEMMKRYGASAEISG